MIIFELVGVHQERRLVVHCGHGRVHLGGRRVRGGGGGGGGGELLDLLPLLGRGERHGVAVQRLQCSA